MSEEIKVPSLGGESITEATISKLHKKCGDTVTVDELIAELETDKVTIEVNSPTAGVIQKLLVTEGDNVAIDDVIALVSNDASAVKQHNTYHTEPKKIVVAENDSNKLVSPAARTIAMQYDINLNTISGSGKNNCITKEDIMKLVENNGSIQNINTVQHNINVGNNNRQEERIVMTKLRQRIAQRLKESQNTAAILTTFNEVDMSAIINIRKKYKEIFEKKHGVKLGFMSFFVKASIISLQEIPAINAEIKDNHIIYKNYYDIGVAVGTDKGLVVPILRNAELKSFADIEKDIVSFGKKAKEGKLSMEELSGGTFTISNGGVYGSLLSTPIINPPQSGILGMHKTMDRAVVIDGKIEVRPMMYLALSYDHRIVDGKEAVTFLVRVKEMLENPERLLFDI